MSAEISKSAVRKCKDCEWGSMTEAYKLKLPLESKIPADIFIPPKIRRECLNIVDTKILGKHRIVGFGATCVKPDSYTPKS